MRADRDLKIDTTTTMIRREESTLRLDRRPGDRIRRRGRGPVVNRGSTKTETGSTTATTAGQRGIDDMYLLVFKVEVLIQ